MPHVIMEYSANLPGFDATQALGQLNQALFASGQVATPLDIKGRAHALQDWVIGTADVDRSAHGFVHVTVCLLSGRTPEAKQSISAALMQVLREQAYPAGVRVQFSVELRDMDRACYGKDARAGG
ncbi:5-carboxymethyl-2-hydroxymuconate Delta-isomerase [Stenotrophomonas sp. MMGLT7]|nr:5-carboxymethyl-2-hydroxymuconate Delta-isomerase [Stenotrophomonas sp. MMGLT7]